MFVLLVLIGKSPLLEYVFELEYSASAINRLRVVMMLLQDTSVTDHNILGKNTRDTTVVTVFSSHQCAKINIYNMNAIAAENVYSCYMHVLYTLSYCIPIW